ncbi:MAG: hypothetical protein HY260_15430, partial [Chloroflexi bacterium]|nr:hypothetical protein [Chloroflexota bacterium]
GVGVDGVDLDAAKERSTIVTNTPFANSVSVAELAIGLMFSLARSIPSAVATTKAGQWARPMGITLAAKTVGVIGLGAIGKQVAMRLRHFDCALVAHDPVADAAFAAVHGIELGALDDLLSRADFVTLHVPLLPTTRGMVNAAFLARMKVGSFLINTARGELIDETALLDALQSGRLRGAALDVFSKEPPGDLPLLRLPQVIATSHIGSHTDGATNAMGWTALRDCLAVLRGEQPAHRVA